MTDQAAPLTEDELLEGYGVATGTPVEVHAAILEVWRAVDALAVELAEVRRLVELVADELAS